MKKKTLQSHLLPILIKDGNWPVLTITGEAILDGTLEVVLADVADLLDGEEIILMTCNPCTGVFQVSSKQPLHIFYSHHRIVVRLILFPIFSSLE